MEIFHVVGRSCRLSLSVVARTIRRSIGTVAVNLVFLQSDAVNGRPVTGVNV